MNTPTGTEAKVCEDIAARQRVGIAKYGTTVEENPLSLREWLKHAYEESLDLSVYLRRAMDERDEMQVQRDAALMMHQKLAAESSDLLDRIEEQKRIIAKLIGWEGGDK